MSDKPQRIGFLTVTGIAGKDEHGHILITLTCDCGEEIVRPRHALRSIKSCGCQQYHGIVGRARRANTFQPQGVDHGAADYFYLKDPDGVVHQGRNLADFIRANAAKFLPQDVVWKNGHCRASVGLNSLNGPVSKSWKGWIKTAPCTPNENHL